MRKGTLSFFLAATLTPFISHAALHPVVSLVYGMVYTHADAIQENITLQSPFQDTYISPSQTTNGPVGGIFLGIESALPWNVLGQIGLSYYRSEALTISGTIWQFANPNFNNKNYQAKIQAQQALIEIKLLATIPSRLAIHPYVLAGIGESFTKSYDYTETPLAPYVVVNPNAFANHTSHSFAYALGLGMEVEVTAHIRIGANYRLTKFGHTHLGLMPNQADTNVLGYNTLQTNELLFDITYVG